MNLNETLISLEKELNEQEKTINVPNVKNGVAVEIEQDQQTAKKILHYFIIKDGNAKFIKTQSPDKNAPDAFTKFAGKYDSLFYMALNAINNNKENNRFKLYNIDRLDVVGYWTDDNVFHIIATSDKGLLQMEFNSKMKKWVKK